MSKIPFSAWIATFLVTIGLQITPCVAFGDWFGRKQTEPLEEVRLGVATPTLTSVVRVADAKRFFSEEGLDVTMKEYPSGRWAVKGMFNNEVDIATTAEVPLVHFSFKRQDFLIFATIGYTDNEPKIVARRDRGIKNPLDLIGKTIAVQKSSSANFFLSLFLTQHYIPESDVDIVYLKPAGIGQALIDGEVDAISMRDPYTQHAKDGLGDNAVEFTAPGLYRKTFDLVAMRDFIEQRPEVIEKVLKAVIRAEQFMHENPAEAINIAAGSLKLPREHIEDIWDNYDFRVSLDQSLLVSLADEARWAIKNKFTDKTRVPNYLDFIYLDGLRAVKPEAATIIH